MYLKLGLVSTLVAAASASIMPFQTQNMLMANEYIERNLDEICISTKPIPRCQDSYVYSTIQNTKVDFYCANKNTDEVKKWISQIDENQVIPEIAEMTKTMKGYVKVPTKCVHVSGMGSFEKLRRQNQQHHSQRIQLVDDESGLNNWYDWDSVEYAKDYDYQQYYNKYDQEEKWQKYDLLNQYPFLKKDNLFSFVSMKDIEFRQFSDKLRKLITSEELNKYLVPEIETVLPTYFSLIAKQLHRIVKDHQTYHIHEAISHESKDYDIENLVGDYNQYRQQMKRIYSYIMKELIVANQKYPFRLNHIPDLIRRVWEDTQRKMTKNQIEKIEQTLEYMQERSQMDQSENELSDWLVNEELKNIHRSTRRNLLRILLTGLNMFKNPSF